MYLSPPFQLRHLQYSRQETNTKFLLTFLDIRNSVKGLETLFRDIGLPETKKVSNLYIIHRMWEWMRNNIGRNIWILFSEAECDYRSFEAYWCAFLIRSNGYTVWFNENSTYSFSLPSNWKFENLSISDSRQVSFLILTFL